MFLFNSPKKSKFVDALSSSTETVSQVKRDSFVLDPNSLFSLVQKFSRNEGFQDVYDYAFLLIAQQATNVRLFIRPPWKTSQLET